MQCHRITTTYNEKKVRLPNSPRFVYLCSFCHMKNSKRQPGADNCHSTHLRTSFFARPYTYKKNSNWKQHICIQDARQHYKPRLVWNDDGLKNDLPPYTCYTPTPSINGIQNLLFRGYILVRRPVFASTQYCNSLSSIPVVQSTTQKHHGGGLHSRCFNSQVHFANTTEPTAKNKSLALAFIRTKSWLEYSLVSAPSSLPHSYNSLQCVIRWQDIAMTECESGYWGHTCTSKCGDECQMCSMITGKCKTCADTFWGTDCNMNCSENCITCLNDSHCMSCIDGYYGVNKCNKTCPSECLEGQCTIDGECYIGCNVGYFGKTCERSCNENCLVVSNTTSCSYADGKCLHGCNQGFTNEFCSQVLGRCWLSWDYKCETMLYRSES